MSATELKQKTGGEDSKNIEERCAERVEGLVENVKNGDFTEFMEVLNTVRQVMGSYSLNNVMLIKMQKPDARIVNGYNQWQDLGRQVREGENGISILAPKLYKACPSCGNTKKYHEKENCEDSTPYENWSKKCFGFRPVTVFDISQTDEIEGEESFTPPTIETEGKDGDKILEELLEISNKWVSGVEIKEDMGVNGLYNNKTEKVCLKKKENKSAMAGTLVHEVAHYFEEKSDREYTQARKEIFVESVSYVVCEELGLDSSSSEKYIKSWENNNVDVEVLQEDMEEIVEISNKILSEIWN